MLAWVQRQAVGGPARARGQADQGGSGQGAVVPGQEDGPGVVEGVPDRGGGVRLVLEGQLLRLTEDFSFSLFDNYF